MYIERLLFKIYILLIITVQAGMVPCGGGGVYQFVLACEMIITDHCSSNYEIHIQELCHINVWQQAVVDPNYLVQVEDRTYLYNHQP